MLGLNGASGGRAGAGNFRESKKMRPEMQGKDRLEPIQNR